MSAIAAFLGRIMVAVLFIVSGFDKLFDQPKTQAMLAAAGLPANLAVAVGLFEIIAGLCLALGFMTRLAAILLAGFTLLAALFYHNQLMDPMQRIQALKNLAIAGGLLGIFAHSQMRWSYDSMRLQRRAEIAERDAAERVHEAELRAAKAEGRADAPATTVVSATPVDTLTVPDRRKRWFWER